jgi:hypothetical protein
VSARAGADARAGEFAPYQVSGTALEAVGENGNCQSGRIRDQQVHMVGFAVELDQLDQLGVEVGADMVVGVHLYGCSVGNTYRVAPTPAGAPVRKPRARKRPKGAPTQCGLHSLAAKDGNGALRPKVDGSGTLVGLQWGAGFVVAIAPPARTGRRGKEQQAELAEIEALSNGVHRAGGCGWQQRTSAAKRTVTRVAELHRRLAEHRKSLHGRLANRLFGHGVDVACEKLDYRAWQKNFPRSVRDRAPGLLVEIIRRKAESAGGDRLYQFNPKTTALSQTCLCGNRKKKPLSQRVHRCGCGIEGHRDIFSAYLALHVRAAGDSSDRLDLQAARQGWLRRQDVDEPPKSSRSALARKRRGRRHPPSRRSVARIKARRQAKTMMRQSRSARTSIANRPTAIPT